MTECQEIQKNRSKSTSWAFFATSLLNEPLEVLFSTLAAAILCRDLKATLFQMALFSTLKPLVSLLSYYWSFWLQRHPHSLVKNIIFTGVLARLPLFFIPFVTSPTPMIACLACYMMLNRGGMPAWMELLKQNIPSQKRNSLFSWSSTLGYLEGAIIGVALGFALDNGTQLWRIFFPVGAAISMMGVFFQAKIPQKEPVKIAFTLPQPKELILAPWKESLALLKERPDFAFFQWCFMAAGAGIMLIVPVAPIFFVKVLNLSYTDIAVAIALAKGLGFVATSPLWSLWLNRVGIYKTCALVFAVFSLYPDFLIFATIHPAPLLLACFFYGVGQAGSHLTWHLSGAIFAHNQDSRRFSEVNVVAVGLRGAVVPSLGIVLFSLIGPVWLFAVSSLLCFVPGLFLLKKVQPAIAVE